MMVFVVRYTSYYTILTINFFNVIKKEMIPFTSSPSLDVYIGNRLRQKRQEKGMTLAAMADKFSLNINQIQKYETGNVKISAMMLYRFSQWLGVTPNYFFEGADDLISCDVADILVVDPDKPLTILMIENNPVDEALFRNAMAQSGVEVVMICVKDTLQALNYVREQKDPLPDIIVFNIDGPSPLCFLKELKNDPLCVTLPVVITTASLTFSTMVKAYKMGAAGYILKPFDDHNFHHSMTMFARYWSHVVVLPHRARG